MEELAIPLVVIGFIIWGIVSVINYIQEANKNHQIVRKAQLDLENKYPVANIDKTKLLEERNSILIEDHLKNLRKDSWPHYVENQVSDCIKEIAMRERVPNIAPKFREWLPVWEKRPGIPAEYIDLKNSLLPKFKERYKKIEEENRIRQAQAEKEYKDKTENEARDFLNSRKDIIDKFLEICKGPHLSYSESKCF